MAVAARLWYRLTRNQADVTVVDLYIFDLIGDWIDDLWGAEGIVTTAKTFLADLQALDAGVRTIRLHVNSPGGDVFSAVTIANALREQRTVHGRAVEASVEGLAASAASVIIQAGDPIRIGDNALIMIHNPWSWVVGEAKEFRAQADALDTIRASLIATYRWHSTLEPDAIAALMDATTWMDADQAVANGFATEKVAGLRAAASLDRRALARLTIPEPYRTRVDALLVPAPVPLAAADVLARCREAGHLALAEDLIRAGATADQVQARLAAAQTTAAAASARATEIRALCQTATLPELADHYLAGAMPIDAIRAQLTTLAARLDQAEIDAALPPDHGTGGGAASWRRAMARATRRFGASAPAPQE